VYHNTCLMKQKSLNYTNTCVCIIQYFLWHLASILILSSCYRCVYTIIILLYIIIYYIILYYIIIYYIILYYNILYYNIWLLLFRDSILARDSARVNIGLNDTRKHLLSRFVAPTGGIVSGRYDGTGAHV